MTTVNITSVLSSRCARAGLSVRSRKALLEAASDLLAEEHEELSARALFDELMNRERLGSTGIGDGVAIPHCRIECSRILGAVLTLDEPVDYDAIDGKGVDLLFVLVVPPEENSAHLELLAALAKIFGNPEHRQRLKSAGSDAELYQQLVGLFSSEAA